MSVQSRSTRRSTRCHKHNSRCREFLMKTTLIFAVTMCVIVSSSRAKDLIWEAAYGEDGIETAYAVCETDDGGFIMAGFTFAQMVSPLPCPVSRRIFLRERLLQCTSTSRTAVSSPRSSVTPTLSRLLVFNREKERHETRRAAGAESSKIVGWMQPFRRGG